jgi:trk system potassium uptake protein TrkA
VAREALILDSNDDLTVQLATILTENGYVARILTTKERAKTFEKIPVYIHTVLESYERVLNELDFSHIEIAVFASPNDMLNLTLARLARSQGVPIVIITARSNHVIKQAEEVGVLTIIPHHCVLSRILRILNLKFTKIIPIRGEVSILEMLVTSDSKILGRTIGELEDDTGSKIAVVRGNELITAREAEIQEGDYLIAVGYHAELQKITE